MRMKSTWFSKIEEHIKNNTTLATIFPEMSSIRIVGTVDETTSINLEIQVGDMGEYQCTWYISYTGYHDEKADLIQIIDVLTTEKEVIHLIDASIKTAETLTHMIFQLERALNYLC